MRQIIPVHETHGTHEPAVISRFPQPIHGLHYDNKMSLSAPLQSTHSTDHLTAAPWHESEQASSSSHENVHEEPQFYDPSYRPNPQKQHFACLYTKQKTQKRKIWLDGRLVVFGCGKVALHAACPAPGSGDPMLDQTELLRAETSAIIQSQQMEMEKFLITIEGPWTGTPNMTAGATASSAAPVSNGMRKVLAQKFRMPAAVVPPPPLLQQNKRRRPLQPGELVRRYYPGASASVDDRTHHGNQGNDRHAFNDPSHRASFNTTRPIEDRQQQHRRTMLPQEENRDVPQHSYRSAPTPNPTDNPSSTLVHGSVVAHAQAPVFSPPVSHSSNSMTNYRSPPEAPFEERMQHSALPISHPAQTSASSFVSNGFNETSFYGEDFEEDDSEDHPAPFQLQHPVRHSTDQGKSNEMAVAGSSAGNTDTGVPSTARSASQLLALFDEPDQPDESSQAEDSNSADEFVLPPQDVSSADESDS